MKLQKNILDSIMSLTISKKYVILLLTIKKGQQMNIKEQTELAQTSIGRIKLHLLCFLRDFHFFFHFKGIIREMA
jgi:hypothetical protein